MKFSLHHNSQLNEAGGSGSGSGTVCFLAAQSNPRDLLVTRSSGFDSDRRLFRNRGGGEQSFLGGDRAAIGRMSCWEEVLEKGRRYSMTCTMEDDTNRLRLRCRGGTEFEGDEGQQRFRLHRGCATSPSLSLESAECVREGTGDRLREDVGVWQALAGDGGVIENTSLAWDLTARKAALSSGSRG